MKIILPKIKRYHVCLTGNRPGISTNNFELANKTAILQGGTVYEDVRCEGRKRLQRLYFNAAQNGTALKKNIDYPALITIL